MAMPNQRGLPDRTHEPADLAWLLPAGLLGVLLVGAAAQEHIDQEDLTFADGTAAGEDAVILDEGSAQGEA